jgi:hypothetical protein
VKQESEKLKGKRSADELLDKLPLFKIKDYDDEDGLGPQEIFQTFKGVFVDVNSFSMANCRKSTNCSTTYYLSLIYLNKNLAF